MQRWWLALALLIGACSKSSGPPAPTGRIVVAITVDWEGADLSAENVDALEDVRSKIGAVPVTHFVSAAYATKRSPADLDAVLARTIHRGDELALHLHVWSSLATAAHVTPRSAPSFLTGTENVVDLEDGDLGFDTDVDTYSIDDLRAMLRLSRQLVEHGHLHVSKSFRAGGYLGTPKMLLAVADEGFTVDSSAIDPRQLHSVEDRAWQDRLGQVWPKIDAGSQPYLVHEGPFDLVELPITSVIDYVTTPELVERFSTAKTALAAHPHKDVFVVVAFHLETISDLGGRLVDALSTVRHMDLARDLEFVTIEQAADLARFSISTSN